MGFPQQLNILTCHQIQAIPKIDYRSNHDGPGKVPTVGFPFGKLLGPDRVGFPEISSWTKPVVISLTADEIDFTSNCPVSNGLVTTVITQHE